MFPWIAVNIVDFVPIHIILPYLNLILDVCKVWKLFLQDKLYNHDINQKYTLFKNRT